MRTWAVFLSTSDLIRRAFKGALRSLRGEIQTMNEVIVQTMKYVVFPEVKKQAVLPEHCVKLEGGRVRHM